MLEGVENKGLMSDVAAKSCNVWCKGIGSGVDRDWRMLLGGGIGGADLERLGMLEGARGWADCDAHGLFYWLDTVTATGRRDSIGIGGGTWTAERKKLRGVENRSGKF